MDADKKLLVIDDEPGHRLMVRAVMEDAGWSVAEAEHGEQGLAALRDDEPDVVLLDMRMPGMDGMEVLRKMRSRTPELPVVMLTAFGSVGSAVEAMKQGAFDYLTKPSDNDELEAVLEKAWNYGRLMRENERLRAQVRGSGERLIGASPAMDRVRELIEQVGPTEATVLVLGESGTGKELVAEELHKASQRREGPLIKVNCAALPADLLESELFGYMRGAFTGAVKDKPGRFQLARGGTLLLDEIGEMPQILQAKLLRAIQEREVEPLGSVAPVQVDVRILASTNRDLTAEVEAGNFREDLFFRLNVLEIRIPPLRERLEDLPELTGFLLEKLGEKNNKRLRAVTPAFLEALTAYHWPGNVRELENVLERALILARTDELGPDLLPPQVLKAAGRGGGGAGNGLRGEKASPESADMATREERSGPKSLEDAERQALVGALEANDGHRERTADALGISRRTLQYKLKKYGLIRRG